MMNSLNIAHELTLKQESFPLTVMYMESLEELGYCYQYISYFLKDSQYIGDKIPENCIFAQYHKDYTHDMKHHIVHELTKDNPRIRLVLATMALGMGLYRKNYSLQTANNLGGVYARDRQSGEERSCGTCDFVL